MAPETYPNDEDIFPSAVLGFRYWRVDAWNRLLNPLTNLTSWQPGINYASGCRDHASPGRGCHCGFNAWYDLESSEEYQGSKDLEVISGAIAGAGRVELHQEGFRSSQAQILALYKPYKSSNDSKSINKIAERYDVSLFFDRSEFISFSKHLTNDFSVVPTESLKTEAKKREGLVDRKGNLFWYKNDELHRENDEPAAIYLGNRGEWWWRGKLHRENDQPAVSYNSGRQEWWKHGVKHRISGPAVIRDDGTQEFWRQGKRQG